MALTSKAGFTILLTAVKPQISDDVNVFLLVFTSNFIDKFTASLYIDIHKYRTDYLSPYNGSPNIHFVSRYVTTVCAHTSTKTAI